MAEKTLPEQLEEGYLEGMIEESSKRRGEHLLADIFHSHIESVRSGLHGRDREMYERAVDKGRVFGGGQAEFTAQAPQAPKPREQSEAGSVTAAPRGLRGVPSALGPREEESFERREERLGRRPRGPRPPDPHDNRPDAIRQRGGQIIPRVSGIGGQSYGSDVPRGGTTIYDHDDHRAPRGSLQWRSPGARGGPGVWERPHHR